MHTLRLNKENETQVATASLIQKDADSLLQKKRIRIGWTRCPVYEIVVPVRCYRCHKYGHRAKECTSDEGAVKNACANCGEKRHIRKECRNEAFCWECKEKGHPAGTMLCERYHNLVREARKASKAELGRAESGDKLGCPRCWHSGHSKETCSELDRGNLCRVCCEEGQVASICKNTPLLRVLQLEGTRIRGEKLPEEGTGRATG
jgi:cellular nucleic acid-binding protein